MTNPKISGLEANVSAGVFAVAFLDLLGQQDRLRAIKDFPSPHDHAAVAELKRKVEDFLRPVLLFRKSFIDFFESFAKDDCDISGLSETQRLEYRECTAYDIGLQPMSDSILVYTPVYGPNGVVSLKGVFGLMAATAASMLTTVLAGHPIRGGIDVGVGVKTNDKEFYGPVLARAYFLESRIAEYPRVAIGDELMSWLQSLAHSRANCAKEQVAVGIARKCLELCDKDDDGKQFLDWLGTGVKDHLGEELDSTTMGNVFTKIMDLYEQCKSDEKLGPRYSRLVDYCKTRAPIWGIQDA